jgi:hypothetical protein
MYISCEVLYVSPHSVWLMISIGSEVLDRTITHTLQRSRGDSLVCECPGEHFSWHTLLAEISDNFCKEEWLNTKWMRRA